MLGTAHQRFVYGRRIRVLAHHVAALLPREASVLDVGAGDGLLARRILDQRPDLRIRGVDVLVRHTTHIPVDAFDGTRLPHPDAAFDAVIMVDVLHHAQAQGALLREIARVAREVVVIKDHVVRGLAAHGTLRFMDWVGNVRHGVALPYAYWTDAQWDAAWRDAGLRVRSRSERLGLYPWPASLVFERGLHFVAALQPVRA
jgi:SAM-dependent methyltransferase